MPESTARFGKRPGLKRPAAFLGGVCAALLLVAGCSINYDEATAEEQTPQGIPDTVATDIVHRVHKNGRLTIQLEAARAETYNAKNETVLTNAHFSEFDDTGATATDGSANRLVFHNDTENAEISGSVRVHSATEKGNVRAESLSWENKPKLLKAPPAEQVVITKDDGSSIQGSGFRGDFMRRELTFDGPVKGTYVQEDKN
jgi:LPS export ABC transporter protein LptC